MEREATVSGSSPSPASAFGAKVSIRLCRQHRLRDLKRAAAREAAWQAELEALRKEHRKRAAATKKLHAAQVRRQKEFLRSIGVPDLSPEEVAERARRDATLAYREEAA